MEHNPKKASLWQNGICISEGISSQEVKGIKSGAAILYGMQLEINRLCSEIIANQILLGESIIKIDIPPGTIVPLPNPYSFKYPSYVSHIIGKNPVVPSFTNEEFEAFVSECEKERQQNESPMMHYGSSTPQLKCKCYRCDKEITPRSQYFDFSDGKFNVVVDCHGKTETVKIKEEDIETVNKQGFWFAFM